MRRTSLITSTILLTGGAALAALAWFDSSFLSAPAGVPEPFQYVPLPALKANLNPIATTTPLSQRLASPFEPSLAQLLEGETVITTAAQMKSVWSKLFNAPYDPALFDFAHDFAILVGGGLLPPGVSFDISSVESVDAEYQNTGGIGGPTVQDAFLAVTATTFLPGVQQSDPPPASFQISLVRVPKDLLDDIVVHRHTIAGV